MEDLRPQIETIARPFTAEAGLVLVDMSVRRYRKSLTIEVLADKPRGGITIDECTWLNRKIGDAIEAQNLIGDHYVLEVNSPGLDRPLKTLADFLRTLERKVNVFLSEPVDGKIEYHGLVSAVEGTDVILDVKSDRIRIPFDKIVKGQQVIE